MKLIVLVALAGLAGCAKDFAYQNTSWGMSDKAVKKARPLSEPMAATSGEAFRFEHTTINGQKTTVAYRFTASGLAGVTIVFDPIKIEKAQYLDAYRQVKELLSEKYGTPDVDAASMAAISKKYHIAESADYQSDCVWRTPKSLIKLTCGGDCDASSGANVITISYQPPVSRTEGL